jgi:GNAT superfamily N-acetyltransferase
MININNFTVTVFQEDDLDKVTDLFKRIRKTEVNYPPAHKVKTDQDIADWIMVGKEADRYIIKNPENFQQVVAYVSAQKIGKEYDYQTSNKLGNTYEYWKKAFGSQELFENGTFSIENLTVIKRLTVDPEYRRQGLAKKIRQHAVDKVIEQKRIPVSIISKTNYKAARLASTQNFECIGEYIGNAETEMTAWMLNPKLKQNFNDDDTV